MSKDRKIQILSMIRDSKDILFGAFSSSLTKQDKANEWRKILQMCLALGLLKDSTKDYSYIRDTFWPNIKKTTLAKVDNARKTGSGGGKSSILTEIDNLVLEIIGKESPSVIGLNQFDLMAEVKPNVQMPNETQNSSEDADNPGLPGHEDNEAAVRKPIRPLTRKVKRWITKNSPQFEDHKEELRLKRRKLELEVEHLELVNHKLRIDILKEEEELGLERSKFTSTLVSLN